MASYNANAKIEDPGMKETMERLVKIEKLAEEVNTLRAQSLQLNIKKESNRECFGAFRRQEIQPNNKLWFCVGGSGQLMIKVPRKNAVSIIELDQVRIAKEIEENRKETKNKTRQMLALQPNLTDMDPYSVKLLLEE